MPPSPVSRARHLRKRNAWGGDQWNEGLLKYEVSSSLMPRMITNHDFTLTRTERSLSVLPRQNYCARQVLPR